MADSWPMRAQLGQEVTGGTPVAATVLWRGPVTGIKDNRVIEEPDEDIGLALPTTRNYTPQIEGAISFAATPATFEQLPYLGEGGIDAIGSGIQDGVGSGYEYDYAFDEAAVAAIQPFTIRTGDEDQAEYLTFSFVEKLVLSGQLNQSLMMSGDWVGQTIAKDPFTASLTPQAVEEILAGKGAFYIDAVGGTIGTTQVNNILQEITITITTGRKARYTLDNNQIIFTDVVFDSKEWAFEVDLTYYHTTDAVAEKDAWRSNTPRLFRLEWLGSALTTSGTNWSNKALRIDIPGIYTEWDGLDKADGSSIVKCKFKGKYDPTADLPPRLLVVNELTAIV